MNEIRRNVPIDEQLEILKRGVVDLVSEDDLRRKLARSQETGQPLRVKLGADPTRPDLHLGHAVILRKMRQFQDLGHKVIMLIGDFTAMIGDPSGKSKTRPPVTLEQTRQNAQSYLEQCKLILRDEPEVLELRFNSEWLEPMGYADVIRLASRYTVARIMERDDFKKRFESGVPISMHELLYPLTQGYDSVALHADIELGGTDQLFNNLVGRALQRDYDQEPQIVMTLPLLVGTDGTEKMSKSLDNYIALESKSHETFADLMKVPDTLLKSYFNLLTDLSLEEISTAVGSGMVNAHKVLASLATGWLHNKLEPNIENLRLMNPELYNEIYQSLDFRNSANNKFLGQRIERIYSPMEDFVNEAGKDPQTNESDSQVSAVKEILNNKITHPKDANDYNILKKQMQTLKRVIESNPNFLPFQFQSTWEEVEKLTLQIDLILMIKAAEDRFRSVAKGGIPDNIPSVVVSVAELDNSLDTQRISMAKLVVLAGLEPSNGAARKLIQNRGLRLNGETYTDPQGSLSRDDLSAEGGMVLQKGKDKFVRLTLES